MSKIFKKFALKDKIAIVVGGSGQLGNQTVDILLKAGCKVINVDLYNKINKKKNYFFFKVNITDERKVILFKKNFKKKFKKLHILINHSHYKGNYKNLDPNNSFFSNLQNYPSREWRNTLDTNLNGLFYLTKHFIPELIKQNKSVILNTSSTYGKVSPNYLVYGNSGINSPAGYSTTKFAIIGFTKYIAAHYGRYGLRANVILPGGVENSKQSRSFRKNYSKLTPLKRLAKKNEYRETILFLVSEASSYMTGSEVVIDGGWTAW